MEFSYFQEHESEQFTFFQDSEDSFFQMNGLPVFHQKPRYYTA